VRPEVTAELRALVEADLGVKPAPAAEEKVTPTPGKPNRKRRNKKRPEGFSA
jgi:hypothetical protein